MAAVNHRDFDQVTADLPPACTFTLGGRKWNCRNQQDVPFEPVREFFARRGGDGEVKVEVEPFFRMVIARDETEAFVEMLRAPDSAVTLGTLQPLIEYIGEQVLGRPTKPAARSSSGSKATGRKSTAGSSSRGTTRRRSA